MMAAPVQCSAAAASTGTCAATASRSTPQMYDGYTWRIMAPIDGRYPTDHVYPPVPREAVVGDSWHRYFVRMVECVQSMDLIRQGMEKYSKAPGGGRWADRSEEETAQGGGLSGNRGARRGKWAS